MSPTQTPPLALVDEMDERVNTRLLAEVQNKLATLHALEVENQRLREQADALLARLAQSASVSLSPR